MTTPNSSANVLSAAFVARNTPVPTRFVLDHVGSDSFLGIYGEPEAIEREYNALYNFEATSGELYWIGDKFAFFGSDMERLQKGMTARLVTKRMFEDAEADEVKIEAIAAPVIELLLNSLKREHFVEHFRAPANIAANF